MIYSCGHNLDGSTPEPSTSPVDKQMPRSTALCSPCQVLNGRHYYEPLESHTADTYGGISRSPQPTAANWKFNTEDATVLTLAKLKTMMDSVPSFPKLPPYYRCHPVTYQELLRRVLPKPGEEILNIKFGGIQIEQDPTVPLGEFLPPEGWEA